MRTAALPAKLGLPGGPPRTSSAGGIWPGRSSRCQTA
jgi:hypothetical protein